MKEGLVKTVLYHTLVAIGSTEPVLPDAPPDFGNSDKNSVPPAPNVPGLPDDEWEYSPNWPGVGPGYKNKQDPTGTVYRPDLGTLAGRREGEQPHWHVQKPGQKPSVFPPNYQWGRGNQRKQPGTFNPNSGTYEIVLIGGSVVIAYIVWNTFPPVSPVMGSGGGLPFSLR